MEEPGSFSGIKISPRPSLGRDIDFAETAAGAGSEPANIVGDLHEVSSKTRKCAFKEADCVMAREGVELVGRILKGKTRLLREAFRNLGAKAFGRIDAGADSRTADRAQAQQRDFRGCA